MFALNKSTTAVSTIVQITLNQTKIWYKNLKATPCTCAYVKYIIYHIRYAILAPLETIYSLASLTQKHLMTSLSKPRASTQLPDRTRRDSSEITNLSRPLGTRPDLHSHIYLTTALNVSLPYQRATKNIMKVTSMDHTWYLKLLGQSDFNLTLSARTPDLLDLRTFMGNVGNHDFPHWLSHLEEPFQENWGDPAISNNIETRRDKTTCVKSPMACHRLRDQTWNLGACLGWHPSCT